MRHLTYNYENKKLTPLYPAENYPVLEVSRKVKPSTTITRGSLVGALTSGVSEVQTVTLNGSPSSGTFYLRFGMARTSALAYNISSADLQTALRALPTIGATGVTVSGSDGGPFTVTFALSGPQPYIESDSVEDNLLVGTSPTVSIAKTTVGVLAGSVAAWSGSKLADPTTGPSVSATTGGTNAVGLYLAQMAWITALGETLPSLPVAVVVPDSTNDRIRFAAINAAGTPDEATGIRYYLNGVMVAEVAVATGAIAQTDVDAMPTSGVVPKGPQTVNTAYYATDGTHIPVGVMPYTVATDNEGRITLGDVAGTGHNGETIEEVGIYVTGAYRMGDIPNVASGITDFFRTIGAYSDSEAVLLL